MEHSAFLSGEKRDQITFQYSELFSLYKWKIYWSQRNWLLLLSKHESLLSIVCSNHPFCFRLHKSTQEVLNNCEKSKILENILFLVELSFHGRPTEQSILVHLCSDSFSQLLYFQFTNKDSERILSLHDFLHIYRFGNFDANYSVRVQRLVSLFSFKFTIPQSQHSFHGFKVHFKTICVINVPHFIVRTLIASEMFSHRIEFSFNLCFCLHINKIFTFINKNSFLVTKIWIKFQYSFEFLSYSTIWK